MSLFDDDDDGIFNTTLTVKSKYASLFDDDEPPSTNTTSIFNNLSAKTTSSETSKQTTQKETPPKSQHKYPSILYSGKVEVYKESESSAEYTTIGIAIAENKSQTTHFQLILYYTKENYLVNVPISKNFVLTNQMKDDRYFGNFYDHKNKPWIFRYISESDVDNLLLYISLAKHIENERKRPTVQDIYIPTKGTVINEAFKVGIQCSTYHEEDGKLNLIDTKNHVTSIGNPNNKKGWDECLEGMRKFGRRAVVVSSGNKTIVYKINVVKLAPLKKESASKKEATQQIQEKPNVVEEVIPTKVNEYEETQPEKVEVEPTQPSELYLPNVSEEKDSLNEIVVEPQPHQNNMPISQPTEDHTTEVYSSPELQQHSNPIPDQSPPPQQETNIPQQVPQSPQVSQNISTPNQTLPPQQQFSSFQQDPQPQPSLYNSQLQQNIQPQQQSIPLQQQNTNPQQQYNINQPHYQNQQTNKPYTNEHYQQQFTPNSNPNNFSPIHTNTSSSSMSITYYNDTNNQYMNQSNNEKQYQNYQYQQQENYPYQGQNTWSQPQTHSNASFHSNTSFNPSYQTQQQQQIPQSRPESQNIPITSETIQIIAEERQLKSEIKESLTKIYDKLDEVSRKLDNTVFAKDIKTVGISARTLLQCIQRIVYENETMLAELDARNREKFGLNFD